MAASRKQALFQTTHNLSVKLLATDLSRVPEVHVLFKKLLQKHPERKQGKSIKRH